MMMCFHGDMYIAIMKEGPLRAHLHPATATRLRHRSKNGLQGHSLATGNLVAVAVTNAVCNSTAPKQ